MASSPSDSAKDGAEHSGRSTLSRPTSRRTLRSLPSSDGSSDNPLFTSSSSSTSNSGGYPVYTSSKKRSSVLGSGSVFVGTSSASSSSTLSPSDGPLSSSISSASSTPPFTLTSAPNLPPLVSRPSNSTLPAQSRAPARSVSEAKEQLQKQALKAELQSLGLSGDSVGAALVQKLGAQGGEGELKGIQAAIATGKTTLLLPAEKLDPSSPISAAFLLDHLILLASPASTSQASAPQGFATLSGLRGYVSMDELVFTSCGAALVESSSALSPGSVDYGDEGVQRHLRGAASPPSPPQASSYPSTMLISSVTPLSIPSSRAPTPASTISAKSATTTSRLAALFAKPAPACDNSPDLPPVVPAPAGLFSDDASSGDGVRRSGASLDLSVLAVGRAIRRSEVVVGITAGVNAQLREMSRSIAGVEGEAPVLDHLVSFASRFQPSPSPSTTPNESSPSTLSSLFSADAEETSQAFQDALHSVRLDLTRNLGSAPASSAASSTPESSSAAVPPPAPPSLEDFAALEDQVDHSLEELEKVLTSVLYDRLYAPPTSKDWHEDENLCSRVAALTVLELDLEHLGLELGDEEGLEGWEKEKRNARESLEALAERVGKELNRLEDPQCRTPSAKLAILVEAHTLIVDGLSKLPPVPLKKELGDDRSSTSDRPREVEMDDASSRTSSLPPSRARSPTRAAEAKTDGNDELLKTPRPSSVLEQEVPEIKLPAAGAASPAISSSVSEATSSSLFDTSSSAVASPPTSVFESSRRSPSTASTSTSSADLILPLLIYSVVRANPPHLVSHLNLITRYRSDSLLRGQLSYCLTNFSAVVEFITNIDVSALGISSQRGFAGSPIATPLSSSPPSFSSTLSPSSSSGARPRAHTTGRLFRGRVTDELGNLAGTANSALAGVVDSSYRLIFSGARGAAGAVGGVAPRSLEDVKNVLDGARGRARESLPFRRSMSSRAVAGAAASPARKKDEPSGTTGQREMVDIAAPEGGTPSIEHADPYAPPPSASSAPPPPAGPPPLPPRAITEPVDSSALSSSPSKLRRDDSDARSVRSISSLLKDSTLGRALGEVREGVAGGVAAAAQAGEDRLGLSERFAGLPSLPGLGRLTGGGGTGGAGGASPAGSRRPSLLNPAASSPANVPAAARGGAAAVAGKAGEHRFLEVQGAAELRIGEVQELLEAYKRMAVRVADLETKLAEKGEEGEEPTTPTA
ncbi:hypothetical protein JCM8547_009229 [Rhodosporidiobolus lusitaniae]